MALAITYGVGETKLEQHEGVVALIDVPPVLRSERLSRDVRQDIEKSETLVREAGLDEGELERLRQAGVVLVSTAEAAREIGRRLPEALAFAPSARDVFLGQDGRAYLDSHSLVVAFDPEMDESAGLDLLGSIEGLRVAPFPGARGTFFVFTSQRSSVELSLQLRDQSRVRYAEPDFLECLDLLATPGDPLYTQQWQWKNDGSGGGTAGADVNAEPAWDRTTGRGVRGAVIDRGVDIAHEDLAAGLSGGGHFERVSGQRPKFVPRTPGSRSFPPHWHGTFCLGMLGARYDNAHGGVGGAGSAALMPVAILGDALTTQSTLARAVRYAASPEVEDPGASPSDGADVISCSIGRDSGRFRMTRALQDAIDHATDKGRGGKGTPIFWAVSNRPRPISEDEVCSYARTIAVGRSTRKDEYGSSAQGPELDFLAPGVRVYSTLPRNRYGSKTGTSYAAPCAASIGALLLSLRPALTWQEVRQLIRDSCKQIGPLPYPPGNPRNDQHGYGRVDAGAAVARLLASPA